MILRSQSISCPLWTQVWLILQAEKGKVILLFGLGRRVAVEGCVCVCVCVCALIGNHGNKGLGTSKTKSRVWRQSSGALAFVFQVSVLSVGHHEYVLECHHSGQPGGL